MEIDEAKFKEVISRDRPAIIDFWAEWCAPCKRLGPVFEKLSQEYENLNFHKIEISNSKELAESLKILGIPCLIMFHKGKEIERFTGSFTEKTLKIKIDEALKKL